MNKEIKKLKSDDKVYTNAQLTNAVKDLLVVVECASNILAQQLEVLEGTNTILAQHQARLDNVCKKIGIRIPKKI